MGQPSHVVASVLGGVKGAPHPCGCGSCPTSRAESWLPGSLYLADLTLPPSERVGTSAAVRPVWIGKSARRPDVYSRAQIPGAYQQLAETGSPVLARVPRRRLPQRHVPRGEQGLGDSAAGSSIPLPIDCLNLWSVKSQM